MKFALWVISCLIWPVLSIFVFPLTYLVPFLIQRRLFEQNFDAAPVTSDVCFHVASYGELEQVLPLLEWYLLRQKNVQLIYTSPSVHGRVLKLKTTYPDHLWVLPLPLVIFFPWKTNSPQRWIRSPLFFFCRYDFYPHLLWSVFKDRTRKVILLQAVAKSSFIMQLLYRQFHLLTPATNNQRERFLQLPTKLNISPAMDFRQLQIAKRLSLSAQVLSQYYPQFAFNAHRLVAGSVWPEDLICLNAFLKQARNYHSFQLLVFPHELKQLNFWCQAFPQDYQVCLLSRDGIGSPSSHQVIIVDIMGILCESYQLAPAAYVGGGFGKSVHSVLEPWMSGCQVFIGPEHQRSLEVEWVHEMAPQNLCCYSDPQELAREMNLFFSNSINTYLATYRLDESLQLDEYISMLEELR